MNQSFLTINFLGDFCQEGRTARFTLEDFNYAFSSLKDLLDSADYNVINLECAPDTRRGVPILKEGPHLSCSQSALQALKNSGIHCLALANNHFADYGSNSVKDSIQLIESMGFDYVGAGNDLNCAKEPLLVKLNEKTIAIINCCEHEFSIASTDQAGCNPLNPTGQFEAIRKVSSEADYIFVFVHGGSEHYNLPSPRMQETYRFFIDCGADLVVNCHQHLFSGYEYYHDKPIIYGLGNLFFDVPDRQNTTWSYGYVLQVTILEGISIKLIPYKQCCGEPVITPLNLAEKKSFESQIDSLNKAIQDPNCLQKKYEDWVSENTNSYIYSLFPPAQQSYLSRKWTRLKQKLFSQKPKTINKLSEKRLKVIYNLIRCESHRDVLLSILNRQIKQASE